MNYRFNHDRAAAIAPGTHYLPMLTCPRGVKVLLLGAGGVATIGQYDGRSDFWRGWFPLPTVSKPRQEEAVA